MRNCSRLTERVFTCLAPWQVVPRASGSLGSGMTIQISGLNGIFTRGSAPW